MSDTTRRRGREERAARNQVRRAANRLLLLSVVLVLGLCAVGLWVTESSDGPETRAGSFYVAAAGIGVLTFVVAGVLLTLARRGRP